MLLAPLSLPLSFPSDTGREKVSTFLPQPPVNVRPVEDFGGKRGKFTAKGGWQGRGVEGRIGQGKAGGEM